MYHKLTAITALLISSSLYAAPEMTIVNSSIENTLDFSYRACAYSSAHLKPPKPICNQPVHVTIPANTMGNKAYVTLEDFTIPNIPNHPFPGQFDRPMLEITNVMLNDASGNLTAKSSNLLFSISNKTAIIFNQPNGTSLLTSHTANY